MTPIYKIVQQKSWYPRRELIGMINRDQFNQFFTPDGPNYVRIPAPQSVKEGKGGLTTKTFVIVKTTEGFEFAAGEIESLNMYLDRYGGIVVK